MRRLGHAAIIVNGKLAQFGSRLLVPVSDMMLAQFAENFSAAAAVVPVGTAVGAPAAPAPAAAAAKPVKELNALALMWSLFKGWFGGLFGKRP